MIFVFLSYRRIDVGLPLAGRVFDVLTSALGEGAVFLDTALSVGAEWPEEINDAVQNCRVFVPLIGPNWMAPGLFDPNNWTRKEVSAALERKIPILPLYLNGGTPA